MAEKSDSLTKRQKAGIGLGVVAAAIGIFALLRKPAAAAGQITLSNLVISPSAVNPGQVVTISIVATNNSTGELSQVINLVGDFMAQQTVTLGPGESRTVSFQVTPQEARSYQVSVDGLSGSFVCTSAAVADIRLSNLVISPSSCYVGDTVTISVTATNYGSVAGSRTITCTVS
jgi:uncharacterized protein (DUF58 family)